MSRPEHTAPPEFFYNVDEATKYHGNSRIASIQDSMARRCLELMEIDEDEGPLLLLDIGCGSGLSGGVISEHGHAWVGMDISPSMLGIALQHGNSALDDGEDTGDLFLQDIGQGVGFRPGVFDGAISVSVIQWLCNADKANNNPRKRLARFFNTLYSSLSRGAKAVLQFYPENEKQIDMIKTAALRAGFTGGIMIDFPESKKAKKYFLVLSAGQKLEVIKPKSKKAKNANKTATHADEEGMDMGSDDEMGEEDEDEYEDEEDEVSNSPEKILNTSVKYIASRMKKARKGKKGDKPAAGTKDYVMYKKKLNKLRGREVPRDSKYTARKRRVQF